MVNITLATATERKSVIVPVTETLANVISSNGVDTTGATIMLKGAVCSLTDQQQTLSSLGIADGEQCILNVAVKASAAMKVKFNKVDGITPVLTVVTDITKDMVEAGYSSLIAKDDKGNQKYFVCKDEVYPCIEDFAFTGNGYVEDKLAASIVLPVGTTKEDVMKKYGQKLIVARKYTEQIAGVASSEKATIEEIFAE